MWEDLNGNGTRDVQEPGAAGVEVLVHGLDGTRVGITNSAGEYQFSGLQAGTYRVQLADSLPIQEGGGPAWVSTYPVRKTGGPIEISVGLETGALAQADFGLIRMSSFARFRGTVSQSGVGVADPRVEAFAGNELCSFPFGIRPAGAPANAYSIAVASEAFAAGCGRLGSTVTFRVNGSPVNEVAVWQPSLTGLQLTLAPQSSPTAAITVAPNTIQPPDTGDGGLR